MSKLERPGAAVLLRRELKRERWSAERAEEYAYRGGPDFVLQHGVEYAPRQLPAKYPRCLAGHCYANAIFIAMLFDVAYVEGYALDPDEQIVHAHAWNADRNGELIDTTWTGAAALVERDGNTIVYVGKPGAAYLGVQFSPGRADDATWWGDASILDDRQRGWPLFRQPWEGENYELPWKPSPPWERVDTFVSMAREHGLDIQEAARHPRGILAGLVEQQMSGAFLRVPSERVT